MPIAHILGNGNQPVAKASFDLNRLEVTIGREEENDLSILGERSVSNHHCAIRRVFGGYVLRDLGSSNGIYKNGEREEKVLLDGKGTVLVSEFPLVLQYSDAEIAYLAQETPDYNRYVTTEDLAQNTLVAPAPTSNKSSTAADSRPEHYKTKKRNPIILLFSFIFFFLVVAAGLLGGFYFKHKEQYGSNFLLDYQERKVMGVWEQEEL